MIVNTTNKYLGVFNKIQMLIVSLNQTGRVYLHWVKSHNGIIGNECADRLANLGHKNNRSENYKLTKEAWYSVLKKKFIQFWNKYWHDEVNASNKGQALKSIRTNIQQKVPIITRNRRAEIVLYRLRTGHVGLAQYLNRFNMKETDLCDQCQVPETVQHFLVHCAKYKLARQ